MEKLIKGLASIALDAASSLLQHSETSSSADADLQNVGPGIVDRSTWAEVVGGSNNSDARKNSEIDIGIKRQQVHKQNLVLDCEDDKEWKTAGGKGHHVSSHYQSHLPPKQYFKVPNEQLDKFKKHPSEQEYAAELESCANVYPTKEELCNLSAACNRLWELDLNRLTPGEDYMINCGGGKKVYQKEDMARNSLFNHVRREVFKRPTYARFYSLLDNYTASDWEQEIITSEEKQEEIAFLEEISRTAPIQYLYQYLAAKDIVPNNFHSFKQHLKSLWFDMYARGGAERSSCAFEHVFVGEVKNVSEQVSGFHNWIKFYLEEANGRIDYRGYILPRRSHSQPDAHSQLLTVQFEWNGILKPVSSTFVGVSPEFELALYTLCFYAGGEDNFVEVGPYTVNIKCYHFGRGKLGSAFPIAEE